MSTKEYPDKLKNFFNELETRRTLLTTITETHNKLINTFISLDETLTKKSEILDTQIQNFKKDTQKTLESFTHRENSIREREANLAANVKQLKVSAIKDIEKGDLEDKTTSGLLKMWFRRMDSKGLFKYLLSKRKEYAPRSEITAATAESVDLLGFVLEIVEDFVQMKLSGIKVTAMADRRWAFGILIQAALPLPLLSIISCEVSRSLKERAMAVLEIWKGVLGDGGVGAVEGTVFLQMVLCFGLKHKFDDEFLIKLMVDFATRRDMPMLAMALGFTHKIKDIIEELVKTGKEIEAVYFACDGGLTDQFPPVPLLKSNLRRYRIITDKAYSSVYDVNNEMSVIRTIIKCVEDQKLESLYPIDELQDRLDELEKKKAKKKKYTSAYAINKRSQGGGGGDGSSRPPKAIRLAMASRQKNHPAPAPVPAPPSAARFSAPYSYSNPTATLYGGQSPVRYGLQDAYPSKVAASYQ